MSRLGRFENILLLPVFAALLCTSGFAEDKKMSGKEVTVTGCLAKGDQPNEYVLKADDGKTYNVMSSSVKLEPHVGHKVTVMGKPAKSHMKKSDGGEHLNVSKLDMVSTSCT